MTDPQAAGQGQPLATLVLVMDVKVGDKPVTPPHGLATGVKRYESDLKRLRTELDRAARDAFSSPDVAVGDLQFRDAAPGTVTAVMQVVAQTDDNLMASGLTTLTDDARAPLQSYVRKVTGELDATVAVHTPCIHALAPDPAPPAPAASLTRGQQRLAQRVSLAMVAVCVIFIYLVLDHIWIFGVVAGWGQ